MFDELLVGSKVIKLSAFARHTKKEYVTVRSVPLKSLRMLLILLVSLLVVPPIIPGEVGRILSLSVEI